MLSNRQDREEKGIEEGKKALAERRLTGSGNGAQKYSHRWWQPKSILLMLYEMAFNESA